MQAYDGPIYIADAALFLKATQPQLGINDPYQLNEEQYPAVLKLLRDQHALIHRYWHDTTVQMSDFKNEGVVASSAWPYQANALKGEKQPIATVFPKEGVTGWADTTMLHADAKHPSCAYKWMNWSLEPKVQGDVAAWFGSVPAAPEGCKASTLLGDEGLRNQRIQPVRQNRLLENPAGAGRQVRAVQPLDAGLHRHHGRPLSRGAQPAAPELHQYGAQKMTIAVQFIDVSRTFGDVRAVDRVSIDIQDGEFFSMLGPSGSGKTTCLRLIAGFEQLTAGSIRIHGKEAANLPPYQRDVNTVFQDYALFPHMSVLDNVAYGLMVKGVDKRERLARAQEALESVALGFVAERKPAQLSGGQRQRVALARALVNRPRVLLLDEPLGALDLKLREQMQVELKKLQRQLGITFIFVTHDQGEALSMSDRVAVFNNGRIEQVDTPRDLYMRPRTPFVAEFVGTSNVVRSELAQRLLGESRTFSIRPEHIRLLEHGGAAQDEIQVQGTLQEIHYQGAATRYEIALNGGEKLLVSQANPQWIAEGQQRQIGQPIVACWPRAAMVPLLEER